MNVIAKMKSKKLKKEKKTNQMIIPIMDIEKDVEIKCAKINLNINVIVFIHFISCNN